MCNLTMEVKYSWLIGHIYLYVILIHYLYHSRCVTAAFHASSVLWEARAIQKHREVPAHRGADLQQ